MNDSRTRQVSVAPVIVRAPAGRALTGGSPEPGAGGVPPAVVSEHGPAGACGGAAKVPVAATVANVRARELDLQSPLDRLGGAGREARAGARRA